MVPKQRRLGEEADLVPGGRLDDRGIEDRIGVIGDEQQGSRWQLGPDSLDAVERMDGQPRRVPRPMFETASGGSGGVPMLVLCGLACGHTQPHVVDDPHARLTQ